MNRIAISAIVGTLAALLLGAAYFGAPYAGVHMSATVAMVIAGVLAFGASTSAFTMVAMGKPAEKKKATRSTRFTDPPASEFVIPFRPEGALQLEIRPATIVEDLDIYKQPSSYAEKAILVTIKKAPDKKVFNPIVLKQLFDVLKPFGKFQHIVLVNEHDEFVGYIPAWKARKDFTGGNGESQIRQYIVDVLNDPAKSETLRDIGGLSNSDMIRDDETVAAAVERSWDGLVRGVVICKHGRNRKPLGIIFKEELYKLAAYGG